jgi:hypothetical protein
MLVHRDHLRARHELQSGMRVEQRLHDGGQADQRDVDPVLRGCQRGAPHDLSRREVAAHGVNCYSHVTRT